MRHSFAICAALSIALAASAADAGCLKGAVVGGVGGHFAGHHALLGAGAGCLVGHHMAAEQRKRDRMAADGRGYYDAHHHFHRT